MTPQERFNLIKAELESDGPTPLADELADWAGVRVGLEWRGYDFGWINPTAPAANRYMTTEENMWNVIGETGRHAPLVEHGESAAFMIPWPEGYDWQRVVFKWNGETNSSIEVWADGGLGWRGLDGIIYESTRELPLALTVACRAAWEMEGE